MFSDEAERAPSLSVSELLVNVWDDLIDLNRHNTLFIIW